MKIYAFADEASPVIDRQIEAMCRNNLDGLEIRNVDGINVSEITLQKAKEVRDKLDSHGLWVWSVGSPLGKITCGSTSTASSAPSTQSLESSTSVRTAATA